MSMTSVRIRSRTGYDLRTFLSQSLVRSREEDMAVDYQSMCEKVSGDDVESRSGSRFLNAVLADQFVILFPLAH